MVMSATDLMDPRPKGPLESLLASCIAEPTDKMPRRAMRKFARREPPPLDDSSDDEDEPIKKVVQIADEDSDVEEYLQYPIPGSLEAWFRIPTNTGAMLKRIGCSASGCLHDHDANNHNDTTTTTTTRTTTHDAGDMGRASGCTSVCLGGVTPGAGFAVDAR